MALTDKDRAEIASIVAETVAATIAAAAPAAPAKAEREPFHIVRDRVCDRHDGKCGRERDGRFTENGLAYHHGTRKRGEDPVDRLAVLAKLMGIK